MVVSFLPGITGVTLMALAIPFTISWEPLPIMLLFGSFVGGATFTGSVTAILVNIPGKSSNAATVLDGYPMARQGRARTAIGCSATASALGSSFGIAVLILLIPVMRHLVLALGPAEFLMLVIWGLTTVAIVDRGSLIKGLAIAGVGFLIAFIGSDPRTAELRYTFGTFHLRDGLGMIPVFLGLFAITEMMDLVVSGRPTISGQTRVEELSGSVRQGALAVFQNFGLFIRSSLIGTVVGMIPGIGGTVASFVAYGHASQSARVGRDNFGRGDIRGVLAPEAANDAKDGGALVPTLAFGVPGGTGTAMLLVALTLHGVVPGRELLNEHLTLVFVLIWSLFLSNWLTSLLGVAAIRPLTTLTVARTSLLVPVIVALAALGAFAHHGRLIDVAVAFGFGIVGYYMKKYGWSRIPLVIALVLAPLFEGYLHLTLQLHDLGRINFWTRPVAMGLMAVTIVSLGLRILRFRGSARGEAS
jgi:TctA family transporter